MSYLSQKGGNKEMRFNEANFQLTITVFVPPGNSSGSPLVSWIMESLNILIRHIIIQSRPEYIIAGSVKKPKNLITSARICPVKQTWIATPFGRKIQRAGLWRKTDNLTKLQGAEKPRG